jgi:hypothetical protein
LSIVIECDDLHQIALAGHVAKDWGHDNEHWQKRYVVVNHKSAAMFVQLQVEHYLHKSADHYINDDPTPYSLSM